MKRLEHRGNRLNQLQNCAEVSHGRRHRRAQHYSFIGVTFSCGRAEDSSSRENCLMFKFTPPEDKINNCEHSFDCSIPEVYIMRKERPCMQTPVYAWEGPVWYSSCLFEFEDNFDDDIAY